MPRAWHDAIARQALFTTLRGNASFFKWRAKYGRMNAPLISQMKAIADENRRLKRMYADLRMQVDLLKEALGKNVDRPSAARQAMHCIAERGAYRQKQGAGPALAVANRMQL